MTAAEPILADRHQLAAEIKQRARGLGFDLVGIAGAAPSQYQAYYRAWLESGQAGTMDYLARRFEERADPAAYLLTPTQWEPQRAEFCRLVDKPADPAAALAALTDEWLTAVGELEQMLAAGDGPVRLDETGDLVISPLSAEDIPTEAIELKAELTEMKKSVQ